MAAGNKTLGFAVRIANESANALDAVKEDLEDVTEQAKAAGREVGDFGNKLGETADFGGDAEQALRGVSDLTGVMAAQFGVSLGPLDAYTGALMNVGGGLEAMLKGGPAVVAQLMKVPAAMGGAIASTWAYVSALTAQAAAFIVANAPLILLSAGLALLAGGIVILIKHWDDITEKVPILGVAFDAVKGVVVGAKDSVVGAFQAVLDFLKDHWPEVATIISGPFAPIVLLATDGFGVRSALVGAFKGLISDVKGFAQDAKDAGAAIGGALKDGLLGALVGVVELTTDIASALLKGLKVLWNFAVQAMNDAIPNSINIEVKGVGFSIPLPANPIPMLSAGGIVTRPTLALIGEAGPEAVVPLSGPNAPKGGVTVNVYALDYRSVEDWLNRGGGDAIADHFSRRRAA